jgi:RHS repeat-associated protein
MATSSADPDRLRHFTEGAAPLTGRLKASGEEVVGAYNAFRQSGSVSSGQLGGLSAFVQLMADLSANEAFVKAVTEALLAADSHHAGVVTIGDATLAAALKAAGVGVAPPYIIVSPSSLLGMPPTSGFVDDPVCAVNGNFFLQATDLAFPGRAGILGLARTYNSLASSRSGAFGSGWSCLLDMAVLPGAGEAIGVVLSDGAEIGFAADPEGALMPETRPHLRLLRHDDGAWELKDGSRITWSFGPEGSLTRVRSGASRLVLGREGGRVISLFETTTGRSVRLDWEGDRVVSAISSDGRAAAYHYDGSHLVEVDRPAGGVSYRIEDDRIASVVDADGVAVVANLYDREGRVASQTSAFGRISAYAYSPQGVTAVADQDQGGARNAFVHDRKGNLVSMVDAYGRAMRMRYDAAGHMVGFTDRRGSVFDIVWNEAGTRPVRRTGPLGYDESWAWDGQDRLVSHRLPSGSASYAYEASDTTPSRVTAPDGSTTLIEVDDDLPVALVDADGVRVELAWDADGQLTAVTDALGNRTRLSYDPAGHLASWRHPSGIEIACERDRAGRVVRAVTAAARWEYEWSPMGRPVAGVDPEEGPWRAAYGPNGALAEIAGGDGPGLRLEYDTYGNMAAITGADGSIYRQAFDGLSQLVSLSDPSGATWRYEHDPEGALLGIVDPTGTATWRVVDALGRTVEEVDAAGRTWRRSYGTDGRLAEILDPAGRVRAYGYDMAGRVVRILDGNGVVASFAYTAAGRLARREDATGAVVSFEYDGAGRPAAVEAGGERTSLVLDGDGRLVRAVDEAARALDVHRDDAGRVIEVRDRQGRIRRFDLDDAGRPLRVQQGPESVTAFSWDEQGMLISATGPLGATTRYRHDPAGRVAGIVDPLGGTTDYGYDAAGRPRTITDPGGAITTLLRDESGSLVGVAYPDGTGMRRWSDPSGRTTGFSGLQTDAPTIRVALDAAGDLVGAAPRHGRRRPLGGAGRIVRQNEPTLVLDGAGRVSSSPDGELYRHDAAGQLIEWAAPGRDPVGYEYDLGGRLVAERDGAAVTRYEHDAAGRLLRRVGPAGAATVFGYDAAGRRVSEEGPEGSAVRYEWDDAGRLAAVGGSGSTTTIRYDNLGLPIEVGGIPVGWDLGGAWPVVAQIGGVTYGRGQGGLIAHREGEEPLSVSVSWTGDAEPLADPWGVGSGSGVRLGYRGELCIDGLVWFPGRPYDPATRSFLAPDPLPNPPGAPCAANPYHYAWNDPATFVDPSGLRPLTQDEFEARKHLDELGGIGQAWEAMMNDPWQTALGLAAGPGGLVFMPGIQAVESGIRVGGDLLSKVRLPDYVVLDVAGGDYGGIVGLNVILTRTGHVYVGPQAGVGVPGISGAVRAGWLDQSATPTARQTDSFIQGWSGSASGYAPVLGGVAGPSVAETWGNEGHFHSGDFATEVGAGVGAGHYIGGTETYDFQLPFTFPGW